MTKCNHNQPEMLKEANYIMKVVEFEWIEILFVKATIILLLFKCFMANLQNFAHNQQEIR